MVYRWKIQGLHKADPQVAAEVMYDLSVQGKLTGHDLVEVSRPEDAPLHCEFEWDDAVAAEKYREKQARNMIQHLVVEKNEANGEAGEYPKRVFFNIQSEGPEYRPIEAIMTTPDSVVSLRQQCLRDLINFKLKYQSVLKQTGSLEKLDSLQLSIEEYIRKEDEENV